MFETEFKSYMCSLKKVTSKTQHSLTEAISRHKQSHYTSIHLTSITFHPHVSSSNHLGNICGRTIYCCHHSRVSGILNTAILYTGTQEKGGQMMCVSSWSSYGVPLGFSSKKTAQISNKFFSCREEWLFIAHNHCATLTRRKQNLHFSPRLVS